VEVIGEIHRALKAGPQVVDIVEDALENMFQQKSDEKNLPGPILILTRNELTCTQLFSASNAWPHFVIQSSAYGIII